MAGPVVSLDRLKDFWHSQVHDDGNWASNVNLLRAVGLFAGSIILLRQFGDLMAV